MQTNSSIIGDARFTKKGRRFDNGRLVASFDRSIGKSAGAMLSSRHLGRHARTRSTLSVNGIHNTRHLTGPDGANAWGHAPINRCTEACPPVASDRVDKVTKLAAPIIDVRINGRVPMPSASRNVTITK